MTAAPVLCAEAEADVAAEDVREAEVVIDDDCAALDEDSTADDEPTDTDAVCETEA